MRISSFQIHQQATSQLQELGAQAAATQQQIAQGKRLTKPGDDPVGAARVVGLNQEMDARAQFVRNAETADVALALEDSVLQQITELIQRVQELTIQAGSGVQTAEDREFIAAEIDARFDELMGLANSVNPSGQYLFSGYKGETAPFALEGGTVAYRGDNGQRQVQIDRGQFIAMNDSGEELFMQVDSPSTQARTGATNSTTAEVNGVQIIDQEAADAFFPDKLVVEFAEPTSPGGTVTYSVVRASDQRPVDGLQNIAYNGSGTVTAAGIQFNIAGAPQAGDYFIVETMQQNSLFAAVKGVAEGLVDIDATNDPDGFRNLIDNTVAT
ncbi:MAG: flagellar hook-associated protein FlgL, partial [Pseudomonadota bacterium]